MLCNPTQLPFLVHSSKTGKFQDLGVGAEEIGLGLVENANGTADNLACLVVELVNGRAKDRLEDGNEVGGESLNGGLVCLVCELLGDDPYRKGKPGGGTYKA